MIGFLANLIPSKAWLYGAIAAIGAAVLAWVRMDAKRDARREDKLKDHEHADEIDDRVARADAPDRVRDFNGAGWRD